MSTMERNLDCHALVQNDDVVMIAMTDDDETLVAFF